MATVRSETAADHAAIEATTRAAFLHAPHTGHNEQFIVAALRAAGALALSLVVEMDGAIAGHIAVSPVTLSDNTPAWFGIGPVSVVPRWQGRGIGTQLVREAIKLLAQSGAAGCVVLGDPAYYGRFGFRQEPGLVLPGVPTASFMALPLAAALPRGLVSYHPAFATGA